MLNTQFISVVVKDINEISSPPVSLNWDFCGFYNLADSKWYYYKDGWHPMLDEPITLGDINFTGTISSNGDQGLTGQRELGGHTFTFKNGLLVGFE